MSSPGEYQTPDGRHVPGMSPEDERAEGALDDEQTAPIRQALARWGDAFLAYLLLPDVDPHGEGIEARFIDCYTGYYESRRALVDAQLEALGWAEALNAFRREQGIWPDDLQWNYDVLFEHCCEVYTISERLGGVHVFQN